MSKVSMKGVIDMHVHTNPDLRLRAYDDFEMMEAGIRVGARAIVLKTHQGTTMDRAYLCNRHNEIVHGKTNNFTMFGSITLNKVVGGINPKAVDVALRLGAKVVWLPTQSAKNHMQKMNQDLSQSVEVVKDGKIVPELRSVLELIRDVRSRGIPIILISHNMPHVFEVADRIHIHRLGSRLCVIRPDDYSMSDAVAFMTGAKVPDEAAAAA